MFYNSCFITHVLNKDYENELICIGLQTFFVSRFLSNCRNKHRVVVTQPFPTQPFVPTVGEKLS